MSQQFSRLRDWYQSRRSAVQTAVLVLAVAAIGGVVGVVVGRQGGGSAAAHAGRSDAERLAMLAAVDRYSRIELTPGMTGRVLAIDVSHCPPDFKAAHVSLVEAAMAYEYADRSGGFPAMAFRRLGLAMQKCINMANYE